MGDKAEVCTWPLGSTRPPPRWIISTVWSPELELEEERLPGFDLGSLVCVLVMFGSRDQKGKGKWGYE